MKQKTTHVPKFERRKYPRIEKILSMILKSADFAFETETKNISESGAYCRISKPVSELEKMDVLILLPTGDPEGSQFHEIRCQGGVVRSERMFHKNSGLEAFFIAIYFIRMNTRDRKKIRRYIQDQLLKIGTV